MFNMIEAIEQSTIYVQKSETGVVFCNRNQLSVVTQKHFEEKRNCLDSRLLKLSKFAK